MTAVQAWVGRAFADTSRVALVRPSTSSRSTREALNRVQGELTAEGFEVVVVEQAVGPEGDAAPGPDGSNVIASIELLVDAEERGAELRVVDRLTHKTVVRRTAIDSRSGPKFVEVLAVRAVELLRASLLELLLRSRPKPPAAEPHVNAEVTERAVRWAARELDPAPQGSWGFEAGTAALAGFDGIGPALLGLLRVRAALTHSLQLRATAAGLGTSSEVTSSTGSAQVTQALALLELLARPWADSEVHPVASLGAGMQYVWVHGSASLPFRGVDDSAPAAAFDGGIGVEVRLSSHFDVALECHAMLTTPQPITRFAGKDGGRISEPSIAATLSIVGWP